MVPRRVRTVVAVLFAGFATGAAGAEGQTVLLGAEAGPAYREVGSLRTFVRSYNAENASLLTEPFSQPGGAASLAWDVRVQVAVLPVVVAVSLGADGYGAETRAEVTDGGGRRVELDVSDVVATLDVAYGRKSGPGLWYAGPTMVVRIRETVLTSVRRSADGTTDAGDPTPSSPLSGEFTGTTTQFALGGALGWVRHVGGAFALTARASATYPVGDRSITVNPWLERLDDGRFPEDMERFAADGNVVSADNAMRTGMDALELRLTFGIAVGTRF